MKVIEVNLDIILKQIQLSDASRIFATINNQRVYLISNRYQDNKKGIGIT